MADVQPSDFPLIRRWLKAGILEDEELHPNEEGTPQRGSIREIRGHNTEQESR